jgi:hypothetical protein
MVHDCGAQVVLEGVENRDEALMAADTGADMVQGYYFARPGTGVPTVERIRSLFAQVIPPSNEVLHDSAGFEASLRSHAEVLQAAAMALETGAGFSWATELLLAVPGTSYGYLVTRSGELLGSSYRDCRLELGKQRHASASHNTPRIQRLVREAAAQPRSVRVTAPYPVRGNPAGCVTLAYGFAGKDEVVVVLCADIRLEPS